VDNFVNILFESWQGYNLLYWKGKKNNFYSYYNINTKKYPENYLGYRIVQRIYTKNKDYIVENNYFLDDQKIKRDDFTRDIFINRYICRPIKFKNSFVYRIHLPITPSSSFFDSLGHGYYIRNITRIFNPKNYYDPFTFSILRESTFKYISEKQSIKDLINCNIYSYVARDFLIEHNNIKSFLNVMESNGWIIEEKTINQLDVYNQLKLRERKINELKKVYKNKEINDKYVNKIFNSIYEQQLKKIKGQLTIEIEDIKNSFNVIWDEALELKNIYREFEPLENSKNIHQDDIHDLYGCINDKALEEITGKNKLLNYLLEIIIWKKNLIKKFPDYNILKNWILTAMVPMSNYSKQLEIGKNSRYNNKNKYNKNLTFSDDKYRLIFNENIELMTKHNKKEKTSQEKLKLLLEEYKSKPENYTKRRIEKEISNFKSILKIIDDLKTLSIKNREKG